MKRLSSYLLALPMLFFCIGCHHNIEPPKLSLDDASIEVDGNIGKIRLEDGEDTFTLKFSASHAWHIEVSGDAVSVCPLEGEAGRAEITVTASSESVDRFTEVGRFVIRIDNSDAVREVRVVRIPPPSDGIHTVVAYFMGTSLYSYFDRNLADMKKAVSEGFLGDNRLVIFRQRSATSAEIGEILYDAESGEALYEVVEEDIDLSEPLTGRSFGEHLLSAMDYARAEHYSLIMLGHSTAWLPEVLLTTYARRPDGFVPSFEKMPGAEVTRTIGEKHVILDMQELAEGLAFAGEKFDCIYFDVCFMSSVEAVYELRNAASFIVASPCEIMGYGSPYDLILEPLFEGDYYSVCEAYYNFYKNYIWPSGCIATIDCSKLEALAEVVKRINAAAVREDFDITAVQAYEGQKRGHWFFDVLDYYSRICADTELVAELERVLNDALPYRYHTDKFYSAYNSQMNDIESYSGISLTPDELCIEILGEQIKSLSDEDARYDKLVYQLATLKYYIEPLRQMEWYGATH